MGFHPDEVKRMAGNLAAQFLPLRIWIRAPRLPYIYLCFGLFNAESAPRPLILLVLPEPKLSNLRNGAKKASFRVDSRLRKHCPHVSKEMVLLWGWPGPASLEVTQREVRSVKGSQPAPEKRRGDGGGSGWLARATVPLRCWGRRPLHGSCLGSRQKGCRWDELVAPISDPTFRISVSVSKFFYVFKPHFLHLWIGKIKSIGGVAGMHKGTEYMHDKHLAIGLILANA